MIRNSIVTLSLVAFLAAPALARGSEVQPADFEARYDELEEIVTDPSVDRSLSATLLALVEEARDNAGDRERFVAITNDISAELAAASASEAGLADALCEQFAPAYVSTFELVTEFEWDYELHKLKSCNDDFECTGPALSLCVQLWWRDGKGSGGINCLSL